MENIKNFFTDTYNLNSWGGGESKSGTGSYLSHTESIRKFLVNFIKENNIKKIFDCSCGDWNWMKEIKENFVDYLGNDVVEMIVQNNNEKYSSDNIKFICGDLIDTLSKFEDYHFDLIICRHTLEHLPTDYVKKSLEIISKKSNYAFITNSTLNDNVELNEFNGVSARGINLNLPPYNNILPKRFTSFWDTVGINNSIDDNAVENLMYVFKL
jgi:2-polyprenyl-3-methyl-5-hydroxy-6-metoxy-1,4-benzoquinol methylase